MDGRRNKISAFTLIEIYTVMAIIAILVSISGLTTRTRNENLALSLQHEKLRSIFVRAKFLSVNSVAGAVQFCGYGVRIDPAVKRMFIFGDEGNCETSDKKYNSSTEADSVQTTSLDVFNEEGGIGFVCLTGVNFDVPDYSLSGIQCGTDFVFIPPDPRVSIKNFSGGNLTGPVAVGVYSKRNPGKMKKIIINQAGLIDAIQK